MPIGPLSNLGASVRLTFDKHKYYPGEEISFSVHIKTINKVSARTVYAILYCVEHEKKTTVKQMTHEDIREMKELGVPIGERMVKEEHEEKKVTFEQKLKLSEEVTIKDSHFQGKFKLPIDAEPTSYEYGHDNKLTHWYLKITVDIPNAFDINYEKEVLVAGLSIE
ncbi:MAG: hypothetical protein N3E37_04965 [Candidatus Micrarchaeota archaeon]|nr:hypothetical protein [Candidatus Micrarchaeota archaeon]